MAEPLNSGLGSQCSKSPRSESTGSLGPPVGSPDLPRGLGRLSPIKAGKGRATTQGPDPVEGEEGPSKLSVEECLLS